MMSTFSVNTEKSYTKEQICQFMPKVELHAHLNGSVTDDMLAELKSASTDAGRTNLQNTLGDKDNNHNIPVSARVNWKDLPLGIPIEKFKIRSLSECWEAFARIHEEIRTPENLYAVTCLVINDFYRDRVIYLELRTTPKKIHEIRSKDIYIKSVVKAIIDSKKILPEISVKLIISIDRRHGEKEARDNIQLTRKWMKMYPDVIVGLDVSGDPTYGSAVWIIPVLEEARQHGISISCHLPEVVNIEETKAFLQFRPERVAHGQFLHPTSEGTNELWHLAKNSAVPVEVCITSNVVSRISPSKTDHYVKLLQEEDMPYIICTDDSGVFDTTVSKEYQKLLQIVPMSFQALKGQCMNSVSYIFASTDEKTRIKSKISKWWDENISVNELEMNQ